MDETRLVEKLARIEALFAGATTEGERDAAAAARQRILDRLRAAAAADPPSEMRFTLADGWYRRLFTALLRRYDLKPYRYHGQRRTTVMVRVPQRFVDETLWPEFVELAKTLETYLSEVTDRVICQVLHTDTSDVAEVDQPARQLTSGSNSPRRPGR